MDLELKPINYALAKYAVMNWHYSKAMPTGKLVKIGVYENKKFIGCILYGRGLIPLKGFHKQFNLKLNEICELVRVADGGITRLFVVII